ncbi:MAG: hypothetical protein PWQ20_1642 [Thermotogaceae bacterium]|nr:hypothetical protein [Thermotogaceae bacterium]
MRKNNRSIIAEDVIEKKGRPDVIKDRYDEYFDLVFKHKLYFSIIPH